MATLVGGVFRRFAHSIVVIDAQKTHQSSLSVGFERFWWGIAICAFVGSTAMGSVLARLLASGSCGSGLVAAGGDICGWLSTHLVAKDIAVAHAALSMVLGTSVRCLCVGVVDGFGIFAGDARGAFYFASILVFMDCVGIFDALCAFGAD